MKRCWQSSSAAYQLQEHLLYKVAKHIRRRQSVLGTMNKHCLVKVGAIIGETNEQMAVPQQRDFVKTIDDLSPQKMDNFMSVPESNVTTVLNLNNQSFYSHSSQSSQKHKKKNIVSRKSLQNPSNITPEPTTSVLQVINPHKKSSKSNCQADKLVKLKGMERIIEEDKYVDILREEKERQIKYEEECEKKRIEEQGRKAKKRDMNGGHLVYDFECRVAKLEPLKAKKSIHVQSLESWIEDDIKIGNKQEPSLIADISNASNITQKEIELELKEAKRFLRYKSEEAQREKSPPSNVIINSQFQQEIEQAFRISSQGVKVKIGNTEIKPLKDLKERSRRRMSKMEYYDLKRQQQIPSALRKNSEKPRVRSQIHQVKTEPDEEYVHLQQPRKRISFALSDRKSVMSNPERIVIMNSQIYNDMLRLTTPIKVNDSNLEKQTDVTQSRRDQLSSVDRYNLMYVKHKGNPPHDPENLARQLNLSSKRSTEMRTLPQSSMVKVKKGTRKISVRL